MLRNKEMENRHLLVNKVNDILMKFRNGGLYDFILTWLV